jgi:hypothetical protein
MASSNNYKGKVTEPVFSTAPTSPTKTEASEKSSVYYSAQSGSPRSEADKSQGDAPVFDPLPVEIADTPGPHATTNPIDASSLSVTPRASFSSLQRRFEDETPTRGFAWTPSGNALPQHNAKDALGALSQSTPGAIFGPDGKAHGQTTSSKAANTIPVTHTPVHRGVHPSPGFVDLAGLVDASSRAVDKQGARLLPDSAYFKFSSQHLAIHQAWSY